MTADAGNSDEPRSHVARSARSLQHRRSTRAGRHGRSAAALLALLISGWFGMGAVAQVTLDLVVLVDGRPVELRPAGAWVEDPSVAERDGDRFVVRRQTERFELAFAGGSVALNAADIGRWDHAHVLAVRVRPQPGGRYGFDVTVRHRDEGWDHYADLFRVVGDGVENGERVLLHPHDNEQPFTRSQADVVAQGTVTVEASDPVHGPGGSVIVLDLEALGTAETTVELQVERRE